MSATAIQEQIDKVYAEHAVEHLVTGPLTQG
jgi:hypothetical protein